MSVEAVNVARVIDGRPMGWYQYAITALCIGVAFIDGYDLVAISYAAPAMRSELMLDAGSLGSIFSAALLGAMIGNMICGPIGDIAGRRFIIIANTALFGVFTLATAFAGSISTLLAVRFLAGFGLGVANVSAYALCAEYAPKRYGAVSVMIATAGYTVGAALGGLIAARVIPAFGWRSVFFIGGGAGIAMALVLIAALPESIRFLVLRGGKEAKISRILSRIDRGFVSGQGARYVLTEETRRGFTPIHLFTEGRAFGTSLLWIMCFMNFMELFFIQQWLPSLAHSAGIGMEAAVLAGSVLQAGALSGAFAYSRYILRRENPFPLLALGFICGGISFILLGQAKASVTLVMLSVFATGFFVPGVQIALNGVVTMHYPTFIRSTGSSWAFGIGRFGSVVGPIIAGLLLSRQWAPSSVLATAAIPALCSACAALMMVRWLNAPARTQERTAP